MSLLYVLYYRTGSDERHHDRDVQVFWHHLRGATCHYCMFCITGLVLMNVIMIGMFKSFGIIYVELQEVYDASPSIASWVASAQQLTFALFGKPLFSYTQGCPGAQTIAAWSTAISGGRCSTIILNILPSLHNNNKDPDLYQYVASINGVSLLSKYNWYLKMKHLID